MIAAAFARIAVRKTALGSTMEAAKPPVLICARLITTFAVFNRTIQNSSLNRSEKWSRKNAATSSGDETWVLGHVALVSRTSRVETTGAI